MEILLAVLALGALLLVFQRWFWALVFWVASLASCFAMLASIVHFQILGALWFCFLMLVCSGIATAIAEAK